MEKKQIFDKESTFCDLKKIITTVLDAEVQSKKKVENWSNRQQLAWLSERLKRIKKRTETRSETEIYRISSLLENYGQTILAITQKWALTNKENQL